LTRSRILKLFRGIGVVSGAVEKCFKRWSVPSSFFFSSPDTTILPDVRIVFFLIQGEGGRGPPGGPRGGPRGGPGGAGGARGGGLAQGASQGPPGVPRGGSPGGPRGGSPGGSSGGSKSDPNDDVKKIGPTC
jgi:hypothetical protein